MNDCIEYWVGAAAVIIASSVRVPAAVLLTTPRLHPMQGILLNAPKNLNNPRSQNVQLIAYRNHVEARLNRPLTALSCSASSISTACSSSSSSSSSLCRLGIVARHGLLRRGSSPPSPWLVVSTLHRSTFRPAGRAPHSASDSYRQSCPRAL